MVYDQGEDELPENLIRYGRCLTCGTPWASVVRLDGARAVKIEAGCPNDVCILGDW
jgi:hypothetical protein